MRVQLLVSLCVLGFAFVTSSPDSDADTLILEDGPSSLDQNDRIYLQEILKRSQNRKLIRKRAPRCIALGLGGMCSAARAAELLEQYRWLKRPGGPGRK